MFEIYNSSTDILSVELADGSVVVVMPHQNKWVPSQPVEAGMFSTLTEKPAEYTCCPSGYLLS